MASNGDRPGDRHKRNPIGYRPPLDIWPLLDARMEQTGRGASAVITEILREHFANIAAPRAEPTQAGAPLQGGPVITASAQPSGRLTRTARASPPNRRIRSSS